MFFQKNYSRKSHKQMPPDLLDTDCRRAQNDFVCQRTHGKGSTRLSLKVDKITVDWHVINHLDIGNLFQHQVLISGISGHHF